MKISDFDKHIVSHYQSDLSIHLEGPIGVGKSTTIEGAPAKLAKALGGSFGMVIITATNMNPNDAMGFNVPQTIDGRFVSRYTEPFWFVTDEGKHLTEYDGGIVFIDEIDKADADVKKMLSEFMLSRRLGPHRLPKGWKVWSAGNRAQDRSGSTKEYDHAINRQKRITIEFDFEDFKSWCFEHDIHPLFIHFAGQNVHMLTAGVPPVQGPFCTPRSLVRCAKDVVSRQENPEEIVIDPVLTEEVQGTIGAAGAAALAATVLLHNEMPRFSDIVKSPKTARLPGRADAQILVVYNLAARVTEETMIPVITYIERMDPEFSISFVKAATKRNPLLIETKTFSEWCMRNVTLMMAITERR